FPAPAHHYRTPILALAAIGLIYGSLLAFRAPDLRGVIAYSSLAQMGLITMGLFAVNELGLDGSVLQMVNHGLISATLFLLAGMVERRALTGELGRLGGMARGRPALATVLLTTGVIALAVPLSSAFAGEFLILAGVFQRGWGWSVVGAVAIVLAAMYVLRLVSAVLHREVGPAVSDSALDLRPAELGVTVPLLACLLALSVRSPHAHGVVADAFDRDRLTALATMIVAGTGLLVTGVAYRERTREDHSAEYYALLAAAGAGMAFFVGANNLMTLFLALE